MKKVFHDLHRWKKRWFKKLGAEGRDVWNWLLDAVYETYGVWEVDLDDMRGDLGYPVTIEKIRQVFGSRIHEFGDQKIFIPHAIIFQYGELSEACKPHRSVMRELKRLGLYELYLEQLANSMETVSELSKNKNNTKTSTDLINGGSGGSPPPAASNSYGFDTVEALKAGVPIVTMTDWLKRYKNRTWIDDQVELAFRFHTANPSETPRTPGAWMKKLHTWLEMAKKNNPPKPSLAEIDLDAEPA